MSKSFLQRRHKNPDHEIYAHITGIKLGNTGKTEWQIEIDGTTDNLYSAEILGHVADILRESENVPNCP